MESSLQKIIAAIVGIMILFIIPVYIAFEKKNYKIPENVEPRDLDLPTCFKVIELQKMKGETKKTRFKRK